MPAMDSHDKTPEHLEWDAFDDFVDGGSQNGDVSGAADETTNAPTSARNSIDKGKQSAKTATTTENGSSTDAQASKKASDASPPHAGVNGNAPAAKRPRTDSSDSSAQVSGPPPIIKRETSVSDLLIEKYIRREQDHAAALFTHDTHAELLNEKHQEREFFRRINHERVQNPGAVFGIGYEGYGNYRTDLRNNRPRLVYPSQRRRAGNRKTKEYKLSKKEMAAVAQLHEELVPLRLDIDMESLKLRDTFTWNLNDRTMVPELFAEKLLEDFALPPEQNLILARQISHSIHEQLQDYYPHPYLENEALDPTQPYYTHRNDEMRILVKLNITIGQQTLVDQFEWDINNPMNSPEDFARQTAADLRLPGEFTTAIAHSIREQTQLFTKSLYITGHPFDGRPVEDADLQSAFLPSPIPYVFRPYQTAKDYTPYLYTLNEAELERTEVSLSREQRRQKRSVNRRGGPALPDLKDRQRTWRTLAISSSIPASAPSLEETGIYKRSRTRKGRGAARDGADESDDSESDTDAPDSPMVHAGTARTRGIRNAANAAQQALRANLARSATPESSTLFESRVSRRSTHVQDSDSDDDKLIVKLKVNGSMLRLLARGHRISAPTAPKTPASTSSAAATSAPANKGSTTPQQAHSAIPQNVQSQSRPSSATPGTPGPAPAKAAPSVSATPAAPAPAPPAASTPTATPANAAANAPPAQQLGALEATHPPTPGNPGPSPPQWLLTSLQTLHSSHPNDNFEATMRYTAVDSGTGKPLPPAAVQAGTTPSGQPLKYMYFPRIRCHDCPGKLYTPGPGMSVENFEVHLGFKQHKERVAHRLSGGN